MSKTNISKILLIYVSQISGSFPLLKSKNVLNEVTTVSKQAKHASTTFIRKSVHRQNKIKIHHCKPIHSLLRSES